MRRILVPLVFLFLAGPALGQGFQGYYDPANWTVNLIDDASTAFIDTSSVPLTLSIVGSDSGSGGFGSIEFMINAPIAGIVSFDWSYSSTDDPGFDAAFFFSTNGDWQLLSSTSGESGTFSIAVDAGEQFGFSVDTADNLFGEGVLTLSNFSAPVAIPEPATVGLVALVGGIGAYSWNRRRRKIKAAMEQSLSALN